MPYAPQHSIIYRLLRVVDTVIVTFVSTILPFKALRQLKAFALEGSEACL